MRLEPIYIERLIHLANFLERLPPEKFDFGHWVDTTTYEGKEDFSCGTTGCALGWATTLPMFRALGLRLREVPRRISRQFVPALVDDVLDPEEGASFDAVGNATNFIFGLTRGETEWLFMPTGDERDDENETEPEDLLGDDDVGDDGRLSRRASSKRVAQHIREFIEARQLDGM